ncbi:MAG TPA: efflux RND transporter permease subunit [Candidatus Baltobacteraceae bacterium]|nr:efflux RND transporter permease subunit [Candidatus Baltobacteraceae bacterium]
MQISSVGLRHRKTIAFLVAVLTVLGAWAYTTTPASIFPNMSFSRIDVVADAGNLPPDQVRVAVAVPLERVFLGLPSVTRVQTTSSQGSAEFIVTFDPKTDARFDLQYVNQAVSQARTTLPPDTNVDAVIINPNQEPVVSYALIAPNMSQTVVREMAQQSLLPQFYGVSGLARILLVGGPDREFHVTLDPGALSAHGLTSQDVSNALSDATTVNALGIRQQYYQRNVILLNAGIKNAEEIARVVVPDPGHAPVTIGDLGSVTLGVAPLTTQVSCDARHAVSLNFFALPGADQVRMADAIKTKMKRIAASLPAQVTAKRYWDQTDLVVASQESLRDAILIGAVLAILVILLFLRNLRMTLVAAIVIPIAMSITIFFVHLTGETMNLMSVGGLAVAVGLIIDDAIVVVENIARNMHLYPNMRKYDVIVLSMGELAAPMAASTFTTVVVFIPLLLLTGVTGFFFRALALTLGSALIVSLLLALFVTPLISSALVRESDEHGGHAGFIARMLEHYEPFLRWTLSHRAMVYGASVAVLLVTAFLMTRLPSDFLPRMDEGQFEVAYTMPVGTTVEASDAAATAMERLALRDPEVTTVGRFTGIDTNGFSPTQVRQGTIRVRLKPGASYEAVSDRLRDEFSAAVPSAQLDFHQILEDMINDMSGSRSPIEITLAGSDQQTLVSLANKIADEISGVRGLTDAFSGVSYDDPTLQVQPLAQRLAALNMNAAQLGTELAASAQGDVATSVPGALNPIPVRVSVAGASPEIGSSLLSTPSGTVALSSVAQLRPNRLSTDVTEINGQRVMLITANYGGANLSSVIAGVQKALRATPLPPGYTATIGGAYEAQQQSFREFLTVIGIAIALVYFVMLATFRSFRLPLVILTAIPLALIGVALGLFITGTPFNVSSFMGLLLLVGLIVKNGILLIDVANRRREEGASVHDALVAAGRTRLRPIVMTTVAAIGGLLPLAFGIGAGSAMEQPLAIAVIGGLSTATAFTLVVIPVLYAGMAGRRELGDRREEAAA